MFDVESSSVDDKYANAIVSIENEESGSARGDTRNRSLMEALKNFYIEGRHCDVVLKSSMSIESSDALTDTRRSFPCHRIMLTSSSAFFDELFGQLVLSGNIMVDHYWESHGVRLLSGDRDNTCRIEMNIASDDIATIVDFIYYGHVDIKPANLHSVLKHAETLSFDSLVKFCRGTLLGQQVTVSNCTTILFSDDSMEFNELTDRAFNILLHNFEEALDCSQDLFLRKCSGEMLSRLLESDELQVRQETDAYWVMMKWLEHDVQTRASWLPSLFALLRVACMPNEFLLHVVMDNDLVLSHKQCISLAKSAIGWQLGHQVIQPLVTSPTSLKGSSDEKKSLTVYHTTERFSAHSLIALTIKGHVQLLSTFSKKCEMLPDKQFWDGFSAIVIDNKLFVFDVEREPDSSEYKAKLEMYDADCGVWESLSPMPTTRVWFALSMVESNGIKYVYTFGGYNNKGEYLDTVEMLPYNSKSKRLECWQCSLPMRVKKSGCASAAIGHKVFVAGGCRSSSLASVEVYDLQAQQWSRCASMKQARYGARMGTTATDGHSREANKLFVFGGVGTEDWMLNSCEKYNCEDDTWSDIASMQIDRFSFGLCFFARKFFIVGGSGAGFSTEVYDPFTDEWLEHSEYKVNPIKRCTQQLVVFNKPNVSINS